MCTGLVNTLRVLPCPCLGRLTTRPERCGREPSQSDPPVTEVKGLLLGSLRVLLATEPRVPNPSRGMWGPGFWVRPHHVRGTQRTGSHRVPPRRVFGGRRPASTRVGPAWQRGSSVTLSYRLHESAKVLRYLWGGETPIVLFPTHFFDE